MLVQGNFHSCTATGVAKRAPEDGEFVAELETAEPDPCHLRFRFESSGVVIDDLDGCRSIYCGAYAGLDARFASSSFQTPAVECKEAPMPDLDAAEKAAERLLKEWEANESEASDPKESPE